MATGWESACCKGCAPVLLSSESLQSGQQNQTNGDAAEGRPGWQELQSLGNGARWTFPSRTWMGGGCVLGLEVQEERTVGFSVKLDLKQPQNKTRLSGQPHGPTPDSGNCDNCWTCTFLSVLALLLEPLPAQPPCYEPPACPPPFLPLGSRPLELKCILF